MGRFLRFKTYEVYQRGRPSKVYQRGYLYHTAQPPCVGVFTTQERIARCTQTTIPAQSYKNFIGGGSIIITKQLFQLYSMLNIKKGCHSERSEEPENISQPRFLVTLGMTPLLDI